MAQVRYTATARRDGRWWVVQCDQLPAAISQVRRLDQAAETHREAIAFVAGIAETDVDVDVTAVVDEPMASQLQRVAQLRAAARDAEQEARALWSASAHELRESGMTVRDIGAVLGVSYQRAHQLIN